MCQTIFSNYFPLNQRYKSLPLAKRINASNKKKPTIWAYSKNLSLGLRPVTISYSKNITCPPSRAGIGKRFNTANIMDKKAVVFQKISQFQESGNNPPIAAKPPTPLYAPVSGLKIFFNCFKYPVRVLTPLLIPAGIDSTKVYLCVSICNNPLSCISSIEGIPGTTLFGQNR